MSITIFTLGKKIYSVQGMAEFPAESAEESSDNDYKVFVSNISSKVGLLVIRQTSKDC